MLDQGQNEKAAIMLIGYRELLWTLIQQRKKLEDNLKTYGTTNLKHQENNFLNSTF